MKRLGIVLTGFYLIGVTGYLGFTEGDKAIGYKNDQFFSCRNMHNGDAAPCTGVLEPQVGLFDYFPMAFLIAFTTALVIWLVILTFLALSRYVMGSKYEA
ncbi:hypothetical protein [Sphingomonas sp. RB1R13]|uniref:hypothetical protein n=1 Tax=Sphingomonas sp. RB1R13 TaxID=3096159 RepID=UPI002FC67DD2